MAEWKVTTFRIDPELKTRAMEKAKKQYITKFSALLTKLVAEYVNEDVAEAHTRAVGRPTMTAETKEAQKLAAELEGILTRSKELSALPSERFTEQHKYAHGYCHEAIGALDLPQLQGIFDLSLWVPKNFEKFQRAA